MSLNGGYAMIKYNSTQEELQIAYRSKKPALFYDENQRAHWAVIEETATQSVDEETQEPITLYGYSYRLLDEGGSDTITLDDIVDKNGNNRFVEGNGTPANFEGLTSTYCKWSLSGTHLMCVLSATLSVNTRLPSLILATFTIPDYIGRKIITTWGNHVEIKEPYLKTRQGSGATMNVWVDYDNNNIKFNLFSIVEPANKERYFRIQFDMLIDSE